MPRLPFLSMVSRSRSVPDHSRAVPSWAYHTQRSPLVGFSTNEPPVRSANDNPPCAPPLWICEPSTCNGRLACWAGRPTATLPVIATSPRKSAAKLDVARNASVTAAPPSGPKWAGNVVPPALVASTPVPLSLDPFTAAAAASIDRPKTPTPVLLLPTTPSAPPLSPQTPNVNGGCCRPGSKPLLVESNPISDAMARSLCAYCVETDGYGCWPVRFSTPYAPPHCFVGGAAEPSSRPQIYGGCARISLNSLIVTFGSVDCIGSRTNTWMPCLATSSMLGLSMIVSNMPTLLLANTVSARRMRGSSKSWSVLGNAQVSDLSSSVSSLSGTGVGTRRSER